METIKRLPHVREKETDEWGKERGILGLKLLPCDSVMIEKCHYMFAYPQTIKKHQSEP